MFPIPVYVAVAWTFLFHASIAERCWMSSYPYYYKGCSKWTLFKDNAQECTEIVLGGHSTSLFDKRRTHRLELPFLSTNQHNSPQNLGEDLTMTPEAPGGNTHDITLYPSHSVTVSSEFPSTKPDDLSVTAYEESSTNALKHTVENISNGNGNKISTTRFQQPKSDSMTTSNYHQLETTGDQQVTNEEMSTTLNQKFESDAISTTTFQHSESVSTTGYLQPTSTGYYDQTSVTMSTTFNGDEHTSTDQEPSDINMSTLTTSFSEDANKSTIKQTTTPKVTTALTLENDSYTTTPLSTVQNSGSLFPSQVTTTVPISTLTDNFLSTTFESTSSAHCRSKIHKTVDDGASQLFIETLGGIQDIQFQAKASNGIRVSLLITSLTKRDFIQVKIGGKANDRSEIKSCFNGQCVLKTEVTTPHYLTSEEFREFWIAHVPGESLSVGRRNDEIPFMQWFDLPFLEIKYVAFSTDDYKAGEFMICSQNGIDFQGMHPSALASCSEVVDHLSCTCELPPLPAEINVCHCLDHFTDVTCLWLPNDCDQLFQNGVVEGGIYTIYPPRNKELPFNVYCNMTADVGYTMLQRRVDGSVDFYRDYASYKKGFGTLNHEFWIGNENIFRLTNQNNYTLRIDMVIEGGIAAFAEYDAFRINDEGDDFRLASLGSYTGSGYDSMALSLGMKFSTPDYDRDVYSGSCAVISGGSWWYKGTGAWCYDANLNGIYGDDHIRPAIIWYEGTVNTFDYLLTYVDMKIRPNSGRVIQGH